MDSKINNINHMNKGGEKYNTQYEARYTGNRMHLDSQGGYRGGQNRGHRGSYRGRNMGGRRGGYRSERSNAPAKENEFIIRHSKSYEEGCPEFEHPQVIGSYSVDNDRNFGLDKSELKFIDRRHLPENEEKKVEFDLKKGIEKDKSYNGSPNDTFENLLQWVISNSTDLKSEENNRLSVDFISQRGALSNIMKSVYFPRTSWTYYAIIYNGTVYMKGKEKDYKTDGTVDRLISRSGNKLEQLMVGGDESEGIDGNSEFRCVFSSHLDDIKLLYAAEVDCTDPELYEEDFHDMGSFITVKSCKELSNEGSQKSFNRFKTGQAWIENHLAGIPRVLFGFRNDDFIIHTLKIINTEDLPEMAKGMWEPNGCINFLNEFLKYVKKIASQHPEVVIEFEKPEYGNITWQVTDEKHMLPTWYTDDLFEEQGQEENEPQNAQEEEQSDEETG